MRIISLVSRTVFVLGVRILWLLPVQELGAAPNSALPAIIEAGFQSWAKGGAVDTILSNWERGGLMEGSNTAAVQARDFRNISSTLGNYRSHEVIQSKSISQLSQVIYVSVNFERGVVYGRFLLYQTDKGWVVQNMHFSERPGAVMPWLAVQGESTSD